jgi:hypothetical protein
MANQQQNGLSPEQTKELVTSKIENLLLPLARDERETMRIKERGDNVIKNISCSVTKDGTMDGRRRSTGILQNLGAIPAPNSLQERFPPSHQGYLAHLNTTIENSQKRLFLLLKSDKLKLLDESFTVTDNGSLQSQTTGQQLSTVELCNALDNAAETMAGYYIAGKTFWMSESEQKAMINQCFEVTITRVVLTSLDGDWQEHLGTVASFATLTIALDLFGNQSSIDIN